MNAVGSGSPGYIYSDELGMSVSPRRFLEDTSLNRRDFSPCLAILFLPLTQNTIAGEKWSRGGKECILPKYTWPSWPPHTKHILLCDPRKLPESTKPTERKISSKKSQFSEECWRVKSEAEKKFLHFYFPFGFLFSFAWVTGNATFFAFLFTHYNYLFVCLWFLGFLDIRFRNAKSLLLVLIITCFFF